MFWRNSDGNDDSHYHQPDDDYLVAQSPRANIEKDDEATSASANQENPWTTALHDTCASLSSLHATPQQVMQHSVSANDELVERPKSSEVMLWNSKDKVPAVVESYRQRQQQQAEEAALLSDASSSWWISRTASQVYKTVAGVSKISDKDDAYGDWNQAGEDYTSAETEVPWQEPVLHLDLAVQCCHAIVSKAASETSKSDHQRHAIVLNREGMADNCFMGWIRQQQQQQSSLEQNNEEKEAEKSPPVLSPTQLLLSQLPDDQMQVLLQVLLDLNHTRMVDDDAIVVGGNADEDAVAVALFRIDGAMHQIETRIHNWTHRRNAALEQAKKLNKKSRNKALVLTQLRRKQLYDHNLEQAHGTLLNLQQTRLAVETAQSQAHVTRVLSETATALQQLNNANGITVEEVGDLKEALSEEYEHLQTVNDSLTQPNADTADDALLLEELKAMMIKDDAGEKGPSLAPTVAAYVHGVGLPSLKHPSAAEEESRSASTTHVNNEIFSPPADTVCTPPQEKEDIDPDERQQESKRETSSDKVATAMR